MEIQVEALQWRQLPANDKKSSWKSNTRHWNWIPLSRRCLLEARTIICHVFHILRFECDLRPAWLIQPSCFFLNNISTCVALPCERYQWISRHFIRALRLGVHFKCISHPDQIVVMAWPMRPLHMKLQNVEEVVVFTCWMSSTLTVAPQALRQVKSHYLPPCVYWCFPYWSSIEKPCVIP